MDATEILERTSTVPEVTLADGDLLLRQGERSGALYVLVAGGLEVQRRGRGVVRMSDVGTLVGEIGWLLDSPATADVVAVGSTVVRRIGDADRFLAEVPEFAKYLATLLAERLWQISSYLSDLQEQFADQGEVLGLVPAVVAGLLRSPNTAIDPGSERAGEVPY